MSSPIYFDNAASAPMVPEAIDAFSAYARGSQANPSSIHAAGIEARNVVESHRAAVAGLVGCEASELVFTSGATEANNLAIRGLLESRLRSGERPHAVVSALEHASVRETLRDLEARGLAVDVVDPDPDGTVPVRSVLAAVKKETVLVSVMAVSNETGAVQPISEIAAGLKALGASRPLFHVDAVQALPCEGFDFKKTGADTASFSAHKIGGPKGIGALAVRRGTVLHPVLTGGGHERGLRSGTENVPGIAGFAAAAARLARAREVDRAGYARMREAVLAALRAESVNAKPLLPDGSPGASNILALEIPGAEADWLVLLLSRAGVMASAGSACASGTRKASSALSAMSLSDARARSVLRLSFGPGNAAEEAARFASALKAAVARKP